MTFEIVGWLELSVKFQQAVCVCGRGAASERASERPSSSRLTPNLPQTTKSLNTKINEPRVPPRVFVWKKKWCNGKCLFTSIWVQLSLWFILCQLKLRDGNKTLLHYSQFWAIKSKVKQLRNIHSMYVRNFLPRLTGETRAIHRCQINLSFPPICLESLKVAPSFDVWMFVLCRVTKESRPAAASTLFLSSCQISRT